MIATLKALSRDQRNTFTACFLGWTLDAFDFFLVIVTVPHIAHDFGATVPMVAAAVTITLAMRPLGALIFGWIADRYGRRIPLMVDVGLFSALELATAFSPNLGVFIIIRAFYGVAMGGEWGLGAALAMESLPAAGRGLFSGILQEGYAVGNLLAGVVLGVLFVHIGWRGMFVLGALPALLIFYIRSKVPESPAWLAAVHQRGESGHPEPSLSRGTREGTASVRERRVWLLFIYSILFMAGFNFMSHGTQDPYPTFLTVQHHFSPAIVGTLNAISAVGAIIGGIVFGTLSQRFGRRNIIVICAILGGLFIPLWAFGQTIALLAFGGFLMQVMVQGAWGIIPAHLNEISPGEVRGTFPGFTYQLGNLIAAGTFLIESNLAKNTFPLNGQPDYAKAMASFMAAVFVAVVIMTLIGRFIAPERRTAALS